MEIATLRLFVQVMHRRGFTEVAKTERVAPSSVSRAIAGLERELGIRLFQRNTRKLEPTEAGRVYFERIAPLLDEIDSAALMAADITETPKGLLRVTAPSVYAQMCIVPLLPKLHARYPDLSVELLMSDAYLDLIAEHIDVAIRIGSLRDSMHIATRLSSMRFHICASPSYLEQNGQPAAPEEIERHNCLLFPRQGHSLNWLFKKKTEDGTGETVQITISGQYLITNSEAIRQCAISGMGLALLPNWLIEKDIQNGALVTLFNDYEVTATDYEGAVWLLRPSRAYQPLKARVFMEFLIQQLSHQ